MQSGGPRHAFYLGIRSTEKERGREIRVPGTGSGRRFGIRAGSQGLGQFCHLVFLPVSNPADSSKGIERAWGPGGPSCVPTHLVL